MTGDETPSALQFRTAAGAVTRIHATGHEWADRTRAVRAGVGATTESRIEIDP